MSAVFPTLSFSLSQPRWACVLDPTLALSPHGLPLVRRLGEVMELWVVRELWHILDNTHFYQEQPETLLPNTATVPLTARQQTPAQAILTTLREWERLRMETDLTGLKLFWIGDGPGESLLPAEVDTDIVWRYETLACSLESRLSAGEILAAAFRDAVALAVARGPAFILTHLPEGATADFPPAICNALTAWEISCQLLSSQDPWVTLEQGQLRHLIVQAGLARLCWAGLRLAVLQLVVPSAAALTAPGPESVPFLDLGEAEDSGQHPELEIDLWQGAQAFWYPL